MPSQESGEDIIGFYTTRLVRASNEDEAIQRACDNVKAQWATGIYASSNKGAIPALSLEWAKRTSFLDVFFFRATGHCFYVADKNAA